MWNVAVGITDTDKMTLFLHCMTDDGVREVRLLQLTSPGGEVSYVEFFAKLQDRFGVEYSADARHKWSEVVLPPSGKLSVHDWIDFQTRFTLARLEVRDASEADAYRILTGRLTPSCLGGLWNE